MNATLDTGALEDDIFTYDSTTWSDYDGDSVYGDFTHDQVTGFTKLRSFEPGIGKFDWSGSTPATPVSESVQFYHTNQIGTTRFMTDSNGARTDSSVYTAFGERVDGTNHRYGYAGAWGYRGPSSDDPGDPYLDFPFLHVGHRYYDAATGRFLQRDPIGVMGGPNVYGYVNSTPTLNIDPSGLTMFTWGGWGAAGSLASCGTVLVLLPAEYIVKPIIERRNRRIDLNGDPSFRKPYNPKNPWDWAKDTSWDRQRRKWMEDHRPKRRPEDNPDPKVPCGPHY